MITKKVSFVIPTKNEEKTIESVIIELINQSKDIGINVEEIIIVDDSSDRTKELAAKMGATVVSGGRKGLGWAMIMGLKHATQKQTDAIVSVDSDGQADISELKDFIFAIDTENADLVLGSRFLKKGLVKYRYPKINRIGTLVLSWMLRAITNLPLTDSHGGMRIMRHYVAQELEIMGTHTYVQETIIDAWEKGFKIIEIPSQWRHRKYGKSRVVSSISQYVLNTLPVLILRIRNRLNIIFFIALSLITLSVLDFCMLLIKTNLSFNSVMNRQSLFLSFMLFSTGINLFLFDVVLGLLTQIKRSRF